MTTGGGFRVALGLVFGLVAPLACGELSRSTSADPELGGAGRGNGGGSSGSSSKPKPAGGSSGNTDAGGSGPAPAGGMASGGDSAGAPAGAGGEPGDLCSSGGGSAPQLSPLPHLAGNKNAFGFALMSSFFLTPCLEQQNYDCLTQLGACPNQNAPNYEDRGRVFAEDFKLGGCLGKTYSITLRVNGIVEGKNYQGGTRRRGDEVPDVYSTVGFDTWYAGGAPTESSYNVMKLTVLQPDGATEVQHYYLNSIPDSEKHITFLIGYEATIKVPGQGVVRFSGHDANCRAVDNCGNWGSSTTCSDARNVPHEPGLAVPETYGGKPVSELNLINGAQQPFHSQIVHVTVTKVEAAP